MNARELNLHHTTSTCTARPLVVRADIPLPTLQIQSCRRASHSNDSNRATVLIEEVDVDIGVEVKVLSRSTAMRYRVWYVNVRRQVGSSYSMLSARPLNTRSRGSATVPHAAARLGTIAVIKRGGKCRGLDGSSQPPTGSRHRSGTHTVGWTSTSASRGGAFCLITCRQPGLRCAAQCARCSGPLAQPPLRRPLPRAPGPWRTTSWWVTGSWGCRPPACAHCPRLQAR